MSVVTLDTITSMANSFSFLTSLTSISLGNTATVTNFNFCFAFCIGLTSFPVIDVSGATSQFALNATWALCSGLTSFPLIDTSACTGLTGTWSNCTGLTGFPAIDTSSCIDLTNAWGGCTGLTSFPLIDTSAAQILFQTWNGCSGLTSFPALNTGNVTDFQQAFSGCSGLAGFPAFDFSSATTCRQAFQSSGITDFPDRSMPLCTNFQDMFNGTPLENCGVLTTSAGTAFDRMFDNCPDLRCLDGIDMTLATSSANMFSAEKLKRPTPDDLLTLSGSVYTNPSPGDCAAWVCSGTSDSMSYTFTNQHVFVTGNISTLTPFCVIKWARTDFLLDFQTGFTFDGTHYSKTVGDVTYQIRFVSTGIYFYRILALNTVDPLTEIGIYPVDSDVCITF